MTRSLPLGLVALALAACGDEAAPAATSASATQTAAKTSAPTATAAASGSAAFPLVVVDELGPTVNGQRSYPKKKGGPEKLAKDVAELPINGGQVPLKVEKKSALLDVVALVKELGANGAPTVKITADARGDLPKELVVVPQSKLVGKPPPCSIVATILKSYETEVWTIKGSRALKGPKGLAGPDMSMAGDTLSKELKKCDSKYAFFSADESLTWEYAHMIAGAIVAADKDKKIEHLVLLDEVPVPGREVKGLLGK